jgi:hypothetical protein
MKSISQEQVLARVRFENPWWEPPHSIDEDYAKMKPRAYHKPFIELLENKSPRRAIILLGPRRVGKTVMLHHSISSLMKTGANPKSICYMSIDSPLYTGLGLDELIAIAYSASGITAGQEMYVFFDEIQYLKDWEIHLKTVVDSYKRIQFIASGSAAAALRLKSIESGAGRFTEFLLPPLTFYEYLDLLNAMDLVKITQKGKDHLSREFEATDIDALNARFVHYLNFGGYPEAIFNQKIQDDPSRYIRNDVIDKVLLRDLPSLYGIQDIQELNSLFTTLAFNTGDEVSLEALSKKSGVAKNTIKRYLEYLQSAFLIKMVHRIDRGGKTFKRANYFKVYLTNPCMRSALFSPISADHSEMGNLVETGVFSQWFHSLFTDLYYARWSDGEVDIVYLDNQKPRWAIEVKWSDAYEDDPGKLSSLKTFLEENPSCSCSVTTKSKSSVKKLNRCNIAFKPASLYCFLLGYNIIQSRDDFRKHAAILEAEKKEAEKKKNEKGPNLFSSVK